MINSAQPAFSEVIKVKDGVFYNLEGHAARMDRTLRHFFNRPLSFALSPNALPEPPSPGLFKCRLVYSEELKKVEYAAYSFRRINSLTLVKADEIVYSFKSVDRRAIQRLAASVETDDILMSQGGAITDTSFANVVFQGPAGLFTPASCLLPGTKRELLLRQGRIEKRPITVADLDQFERIYLINAMMDLDDRISIPLSALNR